MANKIDSQGGKTRNTLKSTILPQDAKKRLKSRTETPWQFHPWPGQIHRWQSTLLKHFKKRPKLTTAILDDPCVRPTSRGDSQIKSGQ